MEYITEDTNYTLVNSDTFNLIDNYIYIYQTQSLIILPTFPETLNDNIVNSYSSTTILNRSAPIYSFANAGPRSVDIRLQLHRDMMNAVNTSTSSYIYLPNLFDITSPDDQAKRLKRKDYVDIMIRELQAAALPKYSAAEKMIDPPIVAIRIGDALFCKGIVDGGVSVDYSGPIINNPLYDENGDYLTVKDKDGRSRQQFGKGVYALADISFKLSEIDPYDAESVRQLGSMRGLSRSLERNVYKKGTF